MTSHNQTKTDLQLALDELERVQKSEFELYQALHAMLTSLRNIGIVLERDVERAERALQLSMETAEENAN